MRKENGKPHLAGIAKEVEKRHGVRLPTGAIRAWLKLAPGPDYLREHEAREAARAAHRPRVPVAPEIAEVRRTLREFRGTTFPLVVVAHPELWKTRPEDLESEYARARRGWLRAA